MESMKISMSGLDVEWQRLQVIAQNLANINSTRDASGEVFRPQRLLSGPDLNFNQLLQSRLAKNSDMQTPRGVRVMGAEEITGGVRLVYEPNHPHADMDGFVSYTDVDHATEMTLMIKTSRAYEANLAAISIAQQMYSKALQLGNRS